MSGKSIRSSLSVAVMLTLLIMTGPFEAADYYCELRDIRMSILPTDSESLIPLADASSEPSDVLWCKWQIHFPIKNESMFVLRGIDTLKYRRRTRTHLVAAENTYSPRIHYKVLPPPSGSTSCSSHAIGSAKSLDTKDSFNVLPLTQGSTLEVKYAQDSSPDGNPPPGLMIELMYKDFCATDIVSFHQRCYRNLESSRTLEEELRFINGDNKIVQLASFKAIDDLYEFTNTSQLKKVRIDGIPFTKVPLNLTQPVRIGLFLERETGRILYLNGLCELEVINNWRTFPFSDSSTDPIRACGSLRVVSGRAVVEFRNCNESLPALISFGETPMEHCRNCSEPVLSWLSVAGGIGC